MKSSDLRNLLLSFGLCAGVMTAVTACSNEKSNNSQQEAALATERAEAEKEAAAKSKELEDSRQSLELQIKELEADRSRFATEKREAELAIASLRYKAQKDLETVEADAKAYAFAKEDRLAEMAQLGQQADQASRKLNQVNKTLADREAKLAEARLQLQEVERHLQNVINDIALREAEAKAEAESHRLQMQALTDTTEAQIEARLTQHREQIASERKAWDKEYADEVARLTRAVVQSQNSVEAARAQAELDHIKAGEALLAQRERILGETEEQVRQMHARVNAEIRQAREEYDSEEATRRAVVDEMMAEAQTKSSQLQVKADALEAERQVVAADRARNEARNAELDELSDSLIQDRRDFDVVVRNFSRQVAAMRTFWEQKGLGDIWKGVKAGESYTFRMILIGSGTIKNIETLRGLINKSHIGNENIEEVKYKETNPNFVKSSNNRSFDRRKLRSTKNGELYQTGLEQSAINDHLLIHGRMEDVADLVSLLNAHISDLAKESGAEAANMIVEAFPVEKVRVFMEIDFHGSVAGGTKRKIRKYAGFKFTPVNSSLDVLSNVNLDNPAEYFARSLNKNLDCQVIDVDCLVDLKKSGLLSQTGKLTYVDHEGVRHQGREISFAQAIDELMHVSQKKIEAMDTIRRMQEEGISINISRDVKVKEGWFSGSYISIDDDVIKQIAVGNKAFEAQKEYLAGLAAQPLLERITLSYSVKAIDEAEGIRDSLSLKFSEAVRTEDGTLNIVSTVSNIGEVESSLPIPKPTPSESNFVDLTLEDFDHGIATPAPARDQGENETDADYNEYLDQYLTEKRQIEKDIADARKVEYIRREGILERDFNYIRGKLSEIPE